MPRYYIVRTALDVEFYVKKGVSAVGWSDYHFADEEPEALCNKIKAKYIADGSSTRLAGRKAGEIRKFLSIQNGDIVLVPTYKGFYMGVSSGKRIYDPDSYDKDLANQIEIDFIKSNGEPIVFKRSNKLTALSTKLGVRGFTILGIEEENIIKEIEEIRSSECDSAYEERVGNLEDSKEREFVNSLGKALSDYSSTGLAAKGDGFEELIKEMFEAYHYSSYKLDKRVGGKGKADADVLAIQESPLGDEFTSALYIQAKHYSGISSDGWDQILAFKEKKDKEAEQNGIIYINEYSFRPNQIKYLLISSGDFPDGIKDAADDKGIICINGQRLAEMLYRVIDCIPSARRRLGFVRSYQRYEDVKGNQL